MSGLKIYSYPHNPRVAKAQIAAAFAGFEIETPKHDFPKDNHTAEFKAKHNPMGKVPVLETPHGSLFESNAILRYVARLRSDNLLLGAGFWEQAQVDQWLDFTANEVESARAVWLLPIFKVLAYNEEAYEQCKKDMIRALTVVNAHLSSRQFMVGQQLTVADISLACALHGLYSTVFDPAFRAQFVHVQRWFELIANQDEFKKFMGPVTYAATEKKAEVTAGAAGGKKSGDKKDKKEKPADASGKDKKEKPASSKDSKKADKKEAAAKPAPAAAADDGLDDEKPAKKAPNPLDSLPESSMNLDATKKLFFNAKPFNPNFWAEFWPKFDAAGYSFWTIKYKYDNENTVYFKSCNAMGGFLQRSEDCRKYAFGVVNMYGTDEDTPPFCINGAWLFRGPDIIAEMKRVDDSEYFDWVKVDATKPEGRAIVERMFTGQNVSDNTKDKLLERRYFK